MLAEGSAAVGLTWMGRSLHFTLELLTFFLHAAAEPSPAAAMGHAHAIVLKPFHRLPLRSLFRAASYQAPSYAAFVKMLVPGVPPAEREAVCAPRALAAARRRRRTTPRPTTRGPLRARAPIRARLGGER